MLCTAHCKLYSNATHTVLVQLYTSRCTLKRRLYSFCTIPLKDKITNGEEEEEDEWEDVVEAGSDYSTDSNEGKQN